MESTALLEIDPLADQAIEDPPDPEKPTQPVQHIRFHRPESEDIARHECRIYSPDGKLKKIVCGTTVGEVMDLPLPPEDHPWAAGRPRHQVGIHYRKNARTLIDIPGQRA